MKPPTELPDLDTLIEGSGLLGSPRAVLSLSDLGALIRNRRRMLSLSQDDLAEATGVSRRFVYDVEQGKASAEFDRVMRLCAALGIRLSAVSG